MHATAYNPEISDLRARAVAVLRPEAGAASMSARTAARCLSGVINLVCSQFSIGTMQVACAALVRHEPSWRTKFGALPAETSTRDFDEAVEMIAVVARGILPIAGETNMRDALSFWAVETDPAIWRSIAGE